jgi:CBS domain containing-hemolysin-like protein
VQFAALGFALVLVVLNAFFVAVEFSLVKVRPTQLEALVEQGRPGAEQALAMRNKLDAWLSACQVGITLASLALGWVGEPAFGHFIEAALFKIAPDSESAHAIAKTLSLVLTFGTITFLHIVLGEQVPKTIAIRSAERTALALAWPMRVFYFVGFPVIWILNFGTRMALRLFGLKQGGEEHEVLHEDELRLIFANSAQAGAIDSSRAELLERALSMMEKTARQVLVPRTQMKYLDLEATMEDNLRAARSAGHTWLPVVRGGLDTIEGLVNVKDLLFLLSRGELKSISQVQRPVLFVPENVTLEQLLTEFRRRHKQVAIVVDEHGGTSGMVTISDVVAELVGNIAKLGRKVEPVRSLPGGRLELPGTVQLDDLEDTLEVEFDVDKAEITTIAGYLMAKLGRVPVVGDLWVLEDYRIGVAKMDGPRVLMVRIEPKLSPAGVQPAMTPPNPRPSS